MSANTPATGSHAWKIFDVKALMQKVQGDEPRIFEFLRSASLSCSVYHLPAGSKDMQSPHLEDEVYFIVEGKAVLEIVDQQQQVGPGSILYVKAHTYHSFFDIEENLTVIALFGAQAKN